MNAKQPSLRGLTAWFVVLAMSRSYFESAPTLYAGAKRQDAAEQEKDKNEERRTRRRMKRRREKRSATQADRKVEFT